MGLRVWGLRTLQALLQAYRSNSSKPVISPHLCTQSLRVEGLLGGSGDLARRIRMGIVKVTICVII